MRLHYLPLIAVAFGLQSGAALADDSGWYLKGAVGYNNMSGFNIQETETVPGFPQGRVERNLETKDGYMLNGVLGYAVSENVAFEVDIAYRNNDVKRDRGPKIDGEMAVTTFLANLVYSFKNSTAFTPFIGAGLGVANTDFSFQRNLGKTSGDGWSASGQLLGGVSWDINDSISLYGQYQLVTAKDTGATASFTVPTNLGPLTIEDKLLDDYQAQTFTLGIRYNF